LHETNAFQIADGDKEAIRRKQRVLEALAASLSARLAEQQTLEKLRNIVVEWIQTESESLRLSLDPGLPWETVKVELKKYAVMFENASVPHWLFKYATLLPACFMSSRSYYSLRQRFAQNGAYQKARAKWLPFLQPAHVDRYRTTRP
jgi:hypothetical protein